MEMRFFLSSALFYFFTCSLSYGSPPVAFSGKIAVDGANFHGTAQFNFSIVNETGEKVWAHSEEENASIENFVTNGRYIVLLGGQGMQPLPSELFLEHDHLLLRISVDLQDGAGTRLLEPDQPITSTPYALVADIARHASIANGVSANGISHAMLSEEIRSDLNRTIDRARLSEDVLAKLDEELVITREMLPEDVRNDLNRTISYPHLSSEVREDLNRTITLADLDQQVVAELNDSVAPGSITTNQLNEQILKYLRPEITQSPVLRKDREQVYTGQTITLSSDAEGKFLSYQWLKDGEPVPGATSREFTITDANGSLHNGNYTLQVSNDFGSVSSEVVQIDINDTRLIHQIDLNSTVNLEMIWVEPGTFTMGQDGVATPVHEVTLTNGFYLGKYEVTQAQYEAVMTGNSDGLSATPSNWPNNPRPSCGEGILGGYSKIPYPFKCPGGGQYPGRVGLCIAHGSPVGVCLPGRHDHGVLMGRYDITSSDANYNMDYSPNPRCWPVQCQPLGLF